MDVIKEPGVLFRRIEESCNLKHNIYGAGHDLILLACNQFKFYFCVVLPACTRFVNLDH